MWGAWIAGALWFGTSPASAKGRHLDRDPRVVVNPESGDEVVIVHGRAGPAGSWIHRVVPSRVLGWQEQDFPSSRTRWRFDGEA